MSIFSKYIKNGLQKAAHLDSRIVQRDQSVERTDPMKRVKALLNTDQGPVWVSGNGVQQLVDKALALDHSSRVFQPHIFGQYVDDYMALYKSNGTIQNNTLIGYKSYLRNHLLPFFGEMPIEDILPGTIQTYINLKSKSLSVKTIREHLDFLNQIFDSAEDDGIISRNPCRSKRIKIIGKPSQKVEAYTDSEYKDLELLLDDLYGAERLCLALSLYTGMRQGEMFALTWENVDLEQMLIYVVASVEWPGQNKGILKSPKTQNGYRSIPIIPQLQMILEEQARPSGFVLTGARCDKDSPMTRQAVKRLYERINLMGSAKGITVPFLSHRGRHSVATILNNAGADDVTITSVLGHSDVFFTKKQYVSRQEKQAQRGMNQLSQYIQNM